MQKPVLCIGVTPALQRTMEFSQVRRGHVNRAHQVSVSPAGKAVNVALVLRTLETPVALTGFLGGATGQWVRDLIAQRGIEERFVRTEAPTRTCTTVLDRTVRGATELVEEAAPPTDDEWRSLATRCRELLPHSALAVLAGALPPQAPVDIYAMFARAAREAGCPLLIDSQKQPLLSALPHAPLLAKLNADELAATFGTPVRRRGDRIDRAQELRRRGAQWVLVTDGANPAVLAGPDGVWMAKPPRIKAVNAVGSGDACTAGIAASLLAGQSVPDALRLGLAAGSANALTLTPGEVDPACVRELLAASRIEKL